MSQNPVRTSAIEAAVTPADELFVNLDGSVLKVRESSWRVDVCGIHCSERSHWIQVHLVGKDEFGVTLATDDLSASGVRDQLIEWLATAAPTAVPLFPAANV